MAGQHRLGLSSRVAAARDRISCDPGGEVAILYRGSGIYYVLDAAGARIWALLREPRTVVDVRDALLAEYDVTAPRLEADLLRLLTRLAALAPPEQRLALGAALLLAGASRSCSSPAAPCVASPPGWRIAARRRARLMRGCRRPRPPPAPHRARAARRTAAGGERGRCARRHRRRAPRQPRRAVDTIEERRLLSVRPGITDLASIVFSDEGDILKGSDDPDLRYNQVIRPWKSRLGLLYVDHAGPIGLDLRLILLTVWSAVHRPAALEAVAALARTLGADEELVQVARRREPLRAAPPPGARHVVQNREAVPT
jgi:hypothetical protein